MGLRTDVGITHQVGGQAAVAHCFLLLSCAESLSVSLTPLHTPLPFLWGWQLEVGL